MYKHMQNMRCLNTHSAHTNTPKYNMHSQTDKQVLKIAILFTVVKMM